MHERQHNSNAAQNHWEQQQNKAMAKFGRMSESMRWARYGNKLDGPFERPSSPQRILNCLRGICSLQLQYGSIMQRNLSEGIYFIDNNNKSCLVLAVSNDYIYNIIQTQKNVDLLGSTQISYAWLKFSPHQNDRQNAE